MIIAGIDIGYYATKIASGDRLLSYPSVTGTADLPRYKLMGSTPPTIKIDEDHEFVYGNYAVDQSRILQRREDRNWITSMEFQRLIVSALSQIVGDDTIDEAFIVSGLPIAFYDDAKTMNAAFQKIHSFEILHDGGSKEHYQIDVKHARVIPQPFGAVLNLALDNNGEIADTDIATGTIGVIDIGGKTTNILSVSKLAERTRQTASTNVGAWDVMRSFRAMISTKYPDIDELRDHEIIRAFGTNTIKLYGEDLDISDYVQDSLRPITERIVNEATQLWGGGANLDKIIISGGGAYYFGDVLQNVFRQSVIADQPEFANVIGYHKLAKRLRRKE